MEEGEHNPQGDKRDRRQGWQVCLRDRQQQMTWASQRVPILVGL
jgi:hypothetical protein